ncbi:MULTISPECIES: hypothetical protein [Silvimonas]|uniref:hypothetical protein n=1 Tax=Silvimonas TaxID=300264 RepID=UPI0024B36089|nr:MULTISPECIES: hypothetical protein [Silvimonas]MDR3428451.1 hypothetical protein [Silvimonas sp.]
MLPSIVITVSISREVANVYGFLVNPFNWPQWASGLSRGIRHENGIWYADSPSGELPVRFTPANEYGVLDHYISPAGVPAAGVPEVYVPLRVVANDDGSDVILTLFRQPGMSDADFKRDQDWVQRDLATLKQVLEQ